MRVVLLAALLFQAAPAQQVTDPPWVVTFSLKGDKPLLDPVVHIHVLVNGRSEGDAAIKANTYMQSFMRDEGKLQFLEAAPKRP